MYFSSITAFSGARLKAVTAMAENATKTYQISWTTLKLVYSAMPSSVSTITDIQRVAIRPTMMLLGRSKAISVCRSAMPVAIKNTFAMRRMTTRLPNAILEYPYTPQMSSISSGLLPFSIAKQAMLMADKYLKGRQRAVSEGVVDGRVS